MGSIGIISCLTYFQMLDLHVLRDDKKPLPPAFLLKSPREHHTLSMVLAYSASGSTRFQGVDFRCPKASDLTNVENDFNITHL
jgi:hypothetical protein